MAPERSDASCGDVRRRRVSRALRSARAAGRASATAETRCCASEGRKRFMGILTLRAAAWRIERRPRCSPPFIFAPSKRRSFPRRSVAQRSSKVKCIPLFFRLLLHWRGVFCRFLWRRFVALRRARPGAAEYKTSAGRTLDPSLQVAPVRLGTRSLPAHYPVSLRAHLQVRVTVAGTASATPSARFAVFSSRGDASDLREDEPTSALCASRPRAQPADRAAYPPRNLRCL